MSGGVEGGGRFVANKHLGLMGEGPGDGNALGLSTRKRAGVLAFDLVGQTHQGQKLRDPLPHLFPRPARMHPPDGARKLGVHAKRGIEACRRILRHHLHGGKLGLRPILERARENMHIPIAQIERHRTSFRRALSRDGPDNRTLARPRRPEKGKPPAMIDRKRGIPRCNLAVGRHDIEA